MYSPPGTGIDPSSPLAQRRRAVRRGAAVRSRAGGAGLRLTTVVLDLGGVVVPTLFEVVTDTCFPPGPFGADERYSDVERGRIQEREYWAELGQRRPDLDIARFMRDRLYVRAEVRQFIGALGGRVAVAGLTNDMTHWFGPGWAEKFPEFGSFDRMLEAARSGVLKPDPAVFRWALRQLGEPAEACLFVDDLLANVRGARAAGMEAELFDVTDPAASVARVLARLGLSDGRPSPRVYRPAATGRS